MLISGQAHLRERNSQQVDGHSACEKGAVTMGQREQDQSHARHFAGKPHSDSPESETETVKRNSHTEKVDAEATTKSRLSHSLHIPILTQ